MKISIKRNSPGRWMVVVPRPDNTPALGYILPTWQEAMYLADEKIKEISNRDRYNDMCDIQLADRAQLAAILSGLGAQYYNERFYDTP